MVLWPDPLVLWLAVQVSESGHWTKESFRNVSCTLFTQYYSPATENLQSEPSSQSQSSIYSAGRDNRDVGDAHYRQLEADNGLKVQIVHTREGGDSCQA